MTYFHRLLADCRGVATIEFALVALAYFPLCFGIIELGLFLWTNDALQSTALLTARCVAISSPACTSSASTYAVNRASTWLNSGMLTASGVTIQTAATCQTAPGTAVLVTLTTSFFNGLTLPPPLPGLTLSASGCYPTSP